MDWKSHAMIGAAAALAVAYALGTRDLAGLAVVASFGAISALVPDLDQDTSKGKAMLDLVFMSFAFYLVYFSGCGGNICLPGLAELSAMALRFFAFLGVYFIFFRFFKPRHRGITHSLVACLGFGILAYLFTGMQLAVAGTIGYLSHLVADQHVRLI